MASTNTINIYNNKAIAVGFEDCFAKAAYNKEYLTRLPSKKIIIPITPNILIEKGLK